MSEQVLPSWLIALAVMAGRGRGLNWKVAFMGDRHDGFSRPDAEQNLGGAWEAIRHAARGHVFFAPARTPNESPPPAGSRSLA